ncbi:peptidylprolyl isomerase [Pelagicoccus mobilis]|uniref:peptidylprolyl isomerase n=1 Tax=Pelagicoccus mobilis TaxID=415221 RepID=A0A934VQY1_9BACT|nr:peptidylprolyl isomerase [Pelagicoccus mobilis]MBK1877043.1 peptidylprolyl isomerase [Pelagicoccus mobilis]
MLSKPKNALISLSALLGLLFLFAGCAKKETQLHATISTSEGDIVVRLRDKETPKTVENFIGLADGTKLLAEGEDAANAKPFYDGLIFHRVIDDFMIQGGCPQGTGTGGPGYQFEDETYTDGAKISGEIKDLKTAETVFNVMLMPHYQEHRGKSPSTIASDLLRELQEPLGIKMLREKTVEEIAAETGFEGELRAQGEVLHPVAYGTLCMANSGPNTNGSQFFIVTKEGGTPWLDGKHTVFGKVTSGMEVAEAISKLETAAQDKPVEDVVMETVRTERRDSTLVAIITTSQGVIEAELLEDIAPKTVENFVGLADGSRLLADGEDPANAKPFYDGLIFHRVIPDFMIQGGCPQGNGMGDPGYSFEDETHKPGPVISGPIDTEAKVEAVYTRMIMPHLQENRGTSPSEVINQIYAGMRQQAGFSPIIGYAVEELAKEVGFEGDLHEQVLNGSVAYGTLCMANSGPNTNGSQFFIVTKEGGTPWLDGKHTVFGEVISGMEVAEAISKVETAAQDRPAEDVTILSIRVSEVKVKVEKDESKES